MKHHNLEFLILWESGEKIYGNVVTIYLYLVMIWCVIKAFI
jgi:hypothetical protein